MWILISGIAAAAVPVALPADQRPDDWDEALRLGDLVWAPGDPVVVVTDDGPTWTVRVRDPDGGTREASVAPPVGADDREDLVWLVVSLLTPVTPGAPRPEPVAARSAGSSVSVPAPVPVPSASPVPSAPVPAAPEPAAPEVAAAAPPAPIVVPAPAPVASAAPGPVPEPRPARARPPRPPPPDDPGLRPWVRVGSALGLRVGLAPSFGGSVTAGLAYRAVGVGLGVGGAARTPLPAAGPDRSYGATPIFFEGHALLRPIVLDLQLGGERRRFRDGDQLVAAGVLPFARAEAGVSLDLGARIHLEPTLAWRRELGATVVRRDGVDVLRLPASSVQAGLALRYR